MLFRSKAIFAALKPGGVFVVVDHASAKGAGFAVAQTLHRADEDAAKAEILSAGFTLDGESNVLADAADDHTRKVFELHDTTDQFALRFKKPANAPRDRRITNAEMKGYFGNSMISLTPRHVFFHEDGTYQELGLPGEQAVQGGRWIADAMHHLCMQHDFDLRGTTTCYDIPVNKKVGDTWTSDTYGIGRMITFRLEKGYVYPPGVLDKKQ